MKIKFKLATAACLALFIARPGTASAADLKVLTTGDVYPLVHALIPTYERETGNTVTVFNETTGAAVKSVETGGTYDLIIVTPAAIRGLVEKGFVLPRSAAAIGKVGVGVAVKDGASEPDISTVAAFKSALLAAHSLTYEDPASGASSGIYLAKLFKKLGIAGEIKSKSVLAEGGLSATNVASGKAELAVQQISELKLVKGVTVVGALPDSIQDFTFYDGSIGAHSDNVPAAKAFIKLLTSPAAVQLLQENGLEPAN